MRHLIDSTRIDQFFNSTRRDAQELLPHLIRKLILATIPPDRIAAIRIPVGDAVGHPGFDGRVAITTTSPFVPSGTSIWEMGTGDPEPKAKKDYASRVADPLGLVPSTTSFVFVGPHRWDGRDTWVKEKNEEKVWQEVRAVDNVDLELWLESAPSVARWLAAQMGLHTPGLADIKVVWGELSGKYGLAIAPELVIGGRDQEMTAVQTWLVSGTGDIRIEAESAEEAEAFFTASILKMPSDQQEAVLARLVYVDQADAVETLASLHAPHFVVARTPEVRRRLAAMKSNMVRVITLAVKPLGATATSSSSVVLPNLHRRPIVDALPASGIAAQKAERIARECKGSFGALLLMAAEVHDALPPWTEGTAASDLISLMLAGQWDGDNPADQKALEQLANRPYQEVEKAVRSWGPPRGPIVRRGQTWDWVAWDFAWDHLTVHLTRADLDRFRGVLQSVLGIPDPRFDLPPDQRWAAPIYGKTHPNSSALRDGLCKSMVQIALHSDQLPDHCGQALADSLVMERLTADGNPNLPAWLSLGHWLPDFAEASPSSFLSAIELLLADAASARAMFAEGGFFGSSPHVDLLWALERLAWAPEHLSRVALILAKLAELDPGGNLRNRPKNSLLNIFLPWKPGTSATVVHRLDSMDLLYTHSPSVTWRLATALLEDRGLHVSTAMPAYRKWAPDEPAKTTTKDYWEFVHPLTQRMLKWAEGAVDRWVELISVHERMRKSHPDFAGQILAGLQALKIQSLSDTDRIALRDPIRHALVRHRQFPGVEWSMTEDELKPFDDLYDRLCPTDIVNQHLWLFGHSADLPREKGDDYEKHARRVAEEREKAVQEVYAQRGVSGLLELSQRASVPEFAGHAIGAIMISDEDEARILDAYLTEAVTADKIPTNLQAGIGFCAIRYRKHGDAWLAKVGKLGAAKWTAVKLANLAWGLPARGQTWDWLHGLSPEAEALYWQQTRIWFLEQPATDLQRATRSLLNAGRPYRAIDMLSHYLPREGRAGQPDIAFPSDLLLEVLNAATKRGREAELFPPRDDNMLGYHLSELLDWAEQHGASPASLATFEWFWLPLLEHTSRYGRRGLKTLQQVLASDPTFFVDVLSLAYKSNEEEEGDDAPTPESSARALQAWRLLNEWIWVPGTAAPPSHKEIERHDGDISFGPGEIDAAKLTDWVTAARSLASAAGRLDVCDSQIGQVLAYSPSDADGLWPCEAVRKLIQDTASVKIEHGLHMGVFNRRGTMWRDSGGKQERALSAKLREHATRTAAKWPRVSAAVSGIAESLDQQGKREDDRSAFEEFE